MSSNLFDSYDPDGGGWVDGEYIRYDDMDGQQCEGYVFEDDEGKKCFVRCPRCKRENYAPSVATGICVWCGFDANKEAA